MKKVIEKAVSVQKGVSTLDVMIKNSKIILLLLIAILALSAAVRCGHSTLDAVDPSFRPQIQTSSLSSGRIDQIIPLPNGKALVAGEFTTYNGQPVSRIVRLNADGTLDTTFNSNLIGSWWWMKMGLQTDGKILVLEYDYYSDAYTFIRLNADGSTDPTFNFTLGEVRDFMVDANDRIILSGGFFVDNGIGSIIRLNPDGSRDPTFQFPLYQSASAVGTQNNKVLIQSQAGLQRLNEDGTLDPSFITRNIDGRIFIVQPDGKILVLTSASPYYPPYSLRRLNENGSDDTGFTSSISWSWFTFALGEDGKIALAVQTQGNNYQIRKLLANGTADSSFTPYNALSGYSFAVQADGGLLVPDSGITPFVTKIVRLFPNGSPDPTFNAGGTGFQYNAGGSVQAIDVQPDSKILIGGSFNHVNDVPRAGIARVNWNGTLDESFQINTSGTGNYFYSINDFSNIHTQSDGKIVATGNFAYVLGGVNKYDLVRLNPDGSIDPSFNLGVDIYPGATFENFQPGTNRFVTYDDGKLLVGTSRGNRLSTVPVKLTATGARDTSFIGDIYPQYDYVHILDVAVQPDGKILLGGRWIQYPPYPYVVKSFLTRLNADGTLDTTFQTREQGSGGVQAFVLLPNGKIVMAENSNVLRLNPDGSVDPTFQVGTIDYGRINTMLLLETGRIFVGGSFSTYNGLPRGNLVQLNADGSVFSPVYDVNGAVSSLAVDANGRVFVGGDFTTIIAGNSGGPRTNIAGLIDAPPTKFDFDGDGRADLATFLAADGMWSILNSQNNQTVSTNFGLSEDQTVPADYDGDGKTDIAVFRPSEATWYLMGSSNGFGAVRWGAAQDKPVAGDFDGDRKADFAVWRASSAVWWILKSSNGESTAVRFGLPGDLPLSYADFDGDRKTDIAVWRPSDGNFYWLASGSGNRFNAVHFGQNGDIPAAADYNGDDKTDLVVYRPSEGNWYQYLTAPNGEYIFTAIRFGLEGDEPVAADYDGDGKTDIAVRRGNSWHILNSTLGYTVQTFGDAGAQAVAAFAAQ